MRIAITGATGFVGRYLVRHLLERGHTLRCWYRPTADRSGMPDAIEWVPGHLERTETIEPLVRGADAVVHAALARAGAGFTASANADLPGFLRANLLGSLLLMDAARKAGVGRFVFVSTCAVHDVILSDRRLDETHPLWPRSHYGAHKAAVEKFVHSYGLGEGWPICALRPTGIYGLAHPPSASRWFDLVRTVVRGGPLRSDRGGKEVHVGDVAKAIGLLLDADEKQITGQTFNCYDLYVSEEAVARIARDLSGSSSDISNLNRGPKNQIDTSKLRALGMTFGGEPLLHRTIEELLGHVAPAAR